MPPQRRVWIGFRVLGCMVGNLIPWKMFILVLCSFPQLGIFYARVTTRRKLEWALAYRRVCGGNKRWPSQTWPWILTLVLTYFLRFFSLRFPHRGSSHGRPSYLLFSRGPGVEALSSYYSTSPAFAQLASQSCLKHHIVTRSGWDKLYTSNLMTSPPHENRFSTFRVL